MSADTTRRWGHARPGPDESFDAVRVGDVIRFNGRNRTVRTISRTPDDRIRMIGFAKLKRSQYPAPLTQYTRSELRSAFDGLVAHRKGPLCAVDVECELTRGIEEGRSGVAWQERVTQDETVGVIW